MPTKRKFVPDEGSDKTVSRLITHNPVLTVVTKFLDRRDILNFFTTVRTIVSYPMIPYNFTFRVISPEDIRIIRSMVGLRSLSVSCKIDEHITILTHFHSLHSLSLRSIIITQECMDVIASLTNLTQLRLNNTQLTARLPPLLKLKELELNTCSCERNFLVSITDCSNLEYLKLSPTTICSNSGMPLLSFLVHLPNLISFSYSSMIHHEIDNITCLTRLKELTLPSYSQSLDKLISMTSLTKLNILTIPVDDTLKVLTALVNLVDLRFGYINVYDIEHLTSLTQLTTLHLTSSSKIEIEHKRGLDSLINLTELSLNEVNIGSNIITQISKLSHLSYLSFETLNLSVDCSAKVATLTNLTTLHIIGPLNQTNIQHISMLTQLIKLKLTNAIFNKEDMKCMTNLQQLRKLSIKGNCNLTNIGYLRAIPFLRKIDLDSCININKTILSEIEHFTNLEYIHLYMHPYPKTEIIFLKERRPCLRVKFCVHRG